MLAETSHRDRTGQAASARAALLCCVCLTAAAAAAERFAFVIPGDDASPTATDFSGLSPGPAGADGFVTLRGGRFHTKRGRLRIWGVNTCFGGSFPAHATAEKVAAHLAKLGVNGVRMHHHDTSGPPRGVWGKFVAGRRTLDANQLDRQDYFLAQLHKHGIYANLNLHVSRTFRADEGFADKDLPRAVRYNKYVLYYEPRMRKLFKEFCRMYLTHENPYRRCRRADDPGIAMVEITNENAFSTRGPGIAAALPEPYRGEFKRQWNAWLKARYKTTADLRAAWNETAEPLAGVVADMGDLARALGAWHLRQDRRYPVKALFDQAGPKDGLRAVRLDIVKPAPSGHLHELMLRDLSVEKGKLYTLSFWARADKDRGIYVDVSNQGPDNWRSLGLGETMRIGPDWRHVERAFRAAETVKGNARVCIKFGASDVDICLAAVRLRRGGRLRALPQGQTVEKLNVEIPLAGWVSEARRDVRQFMVDTEKGFIREIVALLKDELGVKCPVTASQITYHGAEIVAETCDYADIHAYWQHPRFPGRPWDRGNWTIGNTPMERAAARGPMLGRAAWRLLDRPFTLSEWNIPDPGDYAASVVPFAAVTAALQDWDGVFFFQYHSSEKDWFGNRLRGYFSFNGQPVKLAMLAGFANLYRRGDLAPLGEVAAGTLTERLPAGLALSRRIGIDPKADRPAEVAAPKGRRLASPDGAVVWDAAEPARACVTVNTPASRAAWGLIANRTLQLGRLTLRVGPAERDYAAIVLTSLDGRTIEESRRMLLVAVGSAENLNMGWNAARTTVGRAWGTGPTQVNGIAARVELSCRVRAAYALDGCGRRAGAVPVADRGGATVIDVGPQHKTLWYEIVAK